MQGGLTIRELCELAQVSRASYYRSWIKKEPKAEKIALRDAIQRLALKDRHCGYRRILRELKNEGWVVNHKRLLRLMRDDNLLSIRRRRFVVTTDSHHTWRVYPNLARYMIRLLSTKLCLAAESESSFKARLEHRVQLRQNVSDAVGSNSPFAVLE